MKILLHKQIINPETVSNVDETTENTVNTNKTLIRTDTNTENQYNESEYT